ncbi:MAG: hypothetical protein WCF79_14610 [Rhodomicrobium sp.]
MAKTRLAGGDQPLNGLNLIGKAALNVLEPGGDHEITAVAEKGLYVGHEQVGFKQEVVRFCQFRRGKPIQRLSPGGSHASSVVMQCMLNICVAQYFDLWLSPLPRPHAAGQEIQDKLLVESLRKQPLWF